MKKQVILIAGFSALLIASHLIFQKWESNLRRPFHFVLNLSQVQWPKTKPGTPTPPIRGDEIAEVDVAGSFNGWGIPGTLDAELGGHAGWLMDKTGPNLWELSEKLPLPVGRSTHAYKFREGIRDVV